MSSHHTRIKNDPRWHAARAATLERDGHACVECGETAGLEVDHIIDLASIIDTEPDLAFDLANLRALCKPCHWARKSQQSVSTLVRQAWCSPSYPDLSDLVSPTEF